ncbi:MAG: DUF134 domain-containing protein [Deltaproteobacteria bacterium]|nr:DUF134 domain-containing protein [Deltaproteobacteria bacterium]
MVRPKCCRQVGAGPEKTCFRPQGAEVTAVEEVRLTLDEYEAIRLADLEGLYQEEAASLMNVSRQTFGRIVALARRKIADVLVNGKVLRIAGGPVATNAEVSTHCPRCRRAFALSGETPNPKSCPHCRKRA